MIESDSRKPDLIWRNGEGIKWPELPGDPYHEPYPDAWNERLRLWDARIQCRAQALPRHT